jgi:hypothetical protein
MPEAAPAPCWSPPGLTLSQRRRIQWLKVSTTARMSSDDDMDLLDDDQPPLIKDGSPPLTGMDINMVFTLPTEFRGAEEEVTQMCLGPKEVVFKKPKESSQHLKLLYVRGHIDGKPISRTLVDGSAAINMMPYTTVALPST